MLAPLLENMLSPMVLAFALGLIACLAGSTLRVPDPVYQVLSMYLLLAIGLKGGIELRDTKLAELWRPALATVGVGVTAPLAVMWAATRLLRVSREDAASLAAHYGSVSVVTFIAAKTFTEGTGLAVAGILTALVVVMEVPGILVGLAMGRKGQSGSDMGTVLLDLLRCKGVILMVGGLLIGLFSSHKGIEAVKPFFTIAFPGVLVLFLLEMGLLCGQRVKDVLAMGWKVPAFGVGISCLLASVGVAVGSLAGMETGTAAVFGVMAGSASYIAAPAAVAHALPEANPSLSLGLALGISFPFNLALGIPLSMKLAHWLG
jgi:uncharacterized protein